MSDVESSDNRKLLRQQDILARFGELALRSDNLDEILTEACRLVGEALGTDLAKVVKLQDDGKTLLVLAGVGWRPGVVGVATIRVADDTSEGVALKTGEPMISPDIARETRFKYPSFLTDNGVRAVANVLIIGGKDRPPFGILQIDSREPRQFTSNDTTFLRGYANLLAAAVDRLRALDALRGKEAQLRQSQKMEAIGRLAAGVAHDFNNILQSVSGCLELILDDVVADTPAQKYAQLALASTRRGSSLTGQLLSYARKQILQPRPVNVSTFLAEIHEMLSLTMGHTIAIQLRTAEAMLAIRVDPSQLQTALLNLAINAAHAMPGSGTLTVEGYEDSKDGQRCAVIALTDTGVGMDEATLARAYDPFFTTKGLDGSGLGLSMVQGFAEQSGGEVRIESAPGRGTRVELWLLAIPQAGIVFDRQSVVTQLAGSGRVLLVDDNLDVLTMSNALLTKAGFDVVTAQSGDQALAILGTQGRFDALVTDYAMPNMNGLDLIAKARTIQPALAALVITGYAAIDEADAPAEPIAVLHKPFKRDQFIEALITAMRGGSL